MTRPGGGDAGRKVAVRSSPTTAPGPAAAGPDGPDAGAVSSSAVAGGSGPPASRAGRIRQGGQSPPGASGGSAAPHPGQLASSDMLVTPGMVTGAPAHPTLQRG